MDKNQVFRHVTEEFQPDATVFENAEHIGYIQPNGLYNISNDTSDESVQWMIDFVRGVEPEPKKDER